MIKLSEAQKQMLGRLTATPQAHIWRGVSDVWYLTADGEQASSVRARGGTVQSLLKAGYIKPVAIGDRARYYITEGGRKVLEAARQEGQPK